MKIGIDISQIVYEGTGVANYTQNLVENLLQVDKKNDYLLFGSSLRRRARLEHFLPRAQKKIFSFPPLLLEKLWNQWHVWPIERLVGKVDVWHSSDWLQPPTKAKKITTIHDLTVYRYPEGFAVRGGHNIVANQKRRLEWVKKEVDLIIADSEATKKDIIELLKIPAVKIHVIYPAAHERFKPQSLRLVAKIRRKYCLKEKYVLCVAAREPRKNLKGAIEAFRQLGNERLELAIAGKFGWGDEKLKIKKPALQDSAGMEKLKIKILGFVPDDDLPALYSGAACFVYPSFYEGFGIPVLEAMSCGCPVVTSRVSSLPEIVGPPMRRAGALVDPADTDAIAGGINKAIKEGKKWAAAGLRQAKRFSWQKTAREVMAIYREVAKC